MVFSGEQGLTASIREWIAKLDQPASEANDRIFVYPLSHATAETLAAVIEKVFRREPSKTLTKSTSGTGSPPVARPATAGQSPAIQAAAAPAQTSVSFGEGGAAPGAATVVIVADKDTNTLIIQTATWFYPTVEELIRKLDAMPKQVLIEVLIAEITLDDGNKFGIAWNLKGQGPVTVGGETHNFTSSVAQNLGDIAQNSNGLSIMLTEANRLTAVLNASADSSKLNILSAPHILTTNNKEAKIDVGNEIPILKTRTSTATGSTTTNADTITNDIEYRPTGIILTVTPHVNEGGYVTLDVQQEVSDAQKTIIGGIDSPTIRKRVAKTSMVVKDNQTLVVGGLIQEVRTGTKSGLPWLSSLPIIGYLFGTSEDNVKKTELVVMITPHVVNNVEEGDLLTQQIRDRVLTLKKGLDRFRPLQGNGAP